MYSSQSPTARPPEALRVAPYLTHIVTHHGQLTLTPPQNAGRARKPTKKRPDRSQAERRPAEEEPRFTTAVRPAVSRRLQAPAVRTRKQSPGARSPTEHTALTEVLDVLVPDYPPPSFQEAIATSPTYPYTPSAAGDDVSVLSRTPSQHIDPASPHSPPRSDADSPVAEALTPMRPQHMLPSPSCHSSDDDSAELVNLDPSQVWEADRSCGVTLAERVSREMLRREAAESVTALSPPRTPRSSLPRSSSPVTPATHSRRCSHCGSVRPLGSDNGDPHSAGASADEPDAPTASSAYPLSAYYTGKKPRCKRDKLNPSSAPSSPSSTSPTSVASAGTPWASSVTLLGNIFSPHKPSAPAPAHSLKRKESFGVRRLFAGKGKEHDAAPVNRVGGSGGGDDDWEVVTAADIPDAAPSGRAAPKAKDKERPPPPSAPSRLARPFRRNVQNQVHPFTASSSSLPFPPPEKAPLPPAPASTSAPPAHADMRRTRKAAVAPPSPRSTPR
ncbi:hypothetical protein WOLCODRAFT_167820, partial [Wolfiporia cocos MD-104 SS10]